MNNKLKNDIINIENFLDNNKLLFDNNEYKSIYDITNKFIKLYNKLLTDRFITKKKLQNNHITNDNYMNEYQVVRCKGMITKMNEIIKFMED